MDTIDRYHQMDNKQKQLDRINELINSLSTVGDAINKQQAKEIDSICDSLVELYQELEKELETI
jgi:hypothetical protein